MFAHAFGHVLGNVFGHVSRHVFRYVTGHVLNVLRHGFGHLFGHMLLCAYTRVSICLSTRVSIYALFRQALRHVFGHMFGHMFRHVLSDLNIERRGRYMALYRLDLGVADGLSMGVLVIKMTASERTCRRRCRYVGMARARRRPRRRAPPSPSCAPARSGPAPPALARRPATPKFLFF